MAKVLDMPTQSVQRVTMTVKGLRELTGLSTATIYNGVAQGQIPHIRVGTRILFHRDVIESWLRSE